MEQRKQSCLLKIVPQLGMILNFLIESIRKLKNLYKKNRTEDE